MNGVPGVLDTKFCSFPYSFHLTIPLLLHGDFREGPWRLLAKGAELPGRGPASSLHFPALDPSFFPTLSSLGLSCCMVSPTLLAAPIQAPFLTFSAFLPPRTVGLRIPSPVLLLVYESFQ